jgi:hypothetical protein
MRSGVTGGSRAAGMSLRPRIRRATADDVSAIVRILITSKEASAPEAMDDHGRDAPFRSEPPSELMTELYLTRPLVVNRR